MANVLLFHHAQGLTDGVESFAEELRSEGHSVVVPDLYEGKTFATLEAGVEYAQELGRDALVEAAVAAADRFPADAVYAGFSLGARPAQMLAQKRVGARGALLFHGALPANEYGAAWPANVPVQLHFKLADEWVDSDAAIGLATVSQGQLFLYEGSAHLFTDSSLADFDARDTRLVMHRSLKFLASVA